MTMSRSPFLDDMGLASALAEPLIQCPLELQKRPILAMLDTHGFRQLFEEF